MRIGCTYQASQQQRRGTWRVYQVPRRAGALCAGLVYQEVVVLLFRFAVLIVGSAVLALVAAPGWQSPSGSDPAGPPVVFADEPTPTPPPDNPPGGGAPGGEETPLKPPPPRP